MGVAFPILVFAAAALQAQPNVGQTPIAEAPKPQAGHVSNAQPSAEAMAMARATQPADVVIEAAVRMVQTDLGSALFKQPDWADLEKAHPGITAATSDAFADVIRTNLTNTMDDYHRRYARFYASHFTNEEMGELTRLYSSPTGQKLIRAKMGNMSGAKLVDNVLTDPTSQINPSDIAEMHRDSTNKAVAEMSMEDGQQILKLVRPATLMKLKMLGPAMVKFETDMANEPDPALDAAFDAAMDGIIRQFGVGK